MVVRAKRTSWRGITIFISIVIVSGLLLTVSGKMENPFSVFPSFVNLVTTGNENGSGTGGFGRDGGQPGGAPTQTQGQSPAQGRGGQPRGGQGANNGTGTSAGTATNANSQAAANGSSAGQAPAQGPGQFQGQEQRGGQDSISWDQYGGLLFDLWYITACTVVVILVGRLIRFFQRRKKRAATPVFTQS